MASILLMGQADLEVMKRVPELLSHAVVITLVPIISAIGSMRHFG